MTLCKRKSCTSAVAPRHTVSITNHFIAYCWLASCYRAGRWSLYTAIVQRLSKPGTWLWAFHLGLGLRLQGACMGAGDWDGPVLTI